MKKQTVLYVRVNNTVEQAEKQLEELWRFAESQGLEVINAYYEVVSGVAHVHDRTIWHMLEDAKQHKFDTVVIRDITRISRNPQDTLFVLQALDSLGIELVTQKGEATLPKLEGALQ